MPMPPHSPLATAASADNNANAADPAAAATAAAAATGSPPPPEEWLRTARQGLDEPVTWEGLKSILREWREAEAAGKPDAAKTLGRLGRSRETTVAYRAHRARVLAEWRTMSDYATVVMLGWADPIVVDDEEDGIKTKKKGAGPLRSNERLPRPNGGVFTPNDFPYFFEPGAWHELLWSPFGPLTDAEIEAAIARRLRDEEEKEEEGEEGGGNGATVDAVHWVNPIELKSVPAIWHAHVVFFRRKARRK
jgi:hypothetical protein